MRFVLPKSVEQQDIQLLHRVRSRLVGSRTQIANQVRGLLMKYGIVLPRHIGHLRRGMPEVLEDESNELTVLIRRLIASLYGELAELDQRIEQLDAELKVVYAASEPCRRIAAVEGIGLLTATAVVAAMSDGKVFTNGRQLAAWLGLVPRQYSSGGKARLFESANEATCICAHCSSMARDPWYIELAGRRIRAASGLRKSNEGWEPARL